jgi:hypothetical protein
MAGDNFVAKAFKAAHERKKIAGGCELRKSEKHRVGTRHPTGS